MIKINKIEDKTTKLIITGDWNDADYVTNIRDYHEDILPLLIVAKKFYSMRKELENGYTYDISENIECLINFLDIMSTNDEEKKLFNEFTEDLSELLFMLLPVESSSCTRIHTIKHMYIFKDGALYEPAFDNNDDVRNSIHWLMNNDIYKLLCN